MSAASGRPTSSTNCSPASVRLIANVEAAARAGSSVFLLEGKSEVAAAAAMRLEARCPGLDRVGSYCPPYGFENDPRELAKIKKAVKSARPALVLIGQGFPKQERLIRLLRSEMSEPWFVGVGISLSFLAGLIVRVHRAMNRSVGEDAWARRALVRV